MSYRINNPMDQKHTHNHCTELKMNENRIII